VKLTQVGTPALQTSRKYYNGIKKEIIWQQFTAVLSERQRDFLHLKKMCKINKQMESKLLFGIVTFSRKLW
jgi:hypothetical protein